MTTLRAEQDTEENLEWQIKVQLPVWEESCPLTVETVGQLPSPSADSLSPPQGLFAAMVTPQLAHI